MRFTQSSTSAFKLCRRKYRYRYVDQIVSNAPRPAYFDWGTAWDEVMNTLATEGAAAAVLRAEQAGPEHAAALHGYLRTYAGDYLRPVKSQIFIQSALTDTGPTDVFQGMADMIAQDDAGRLWLVDNKSASRIDAGRMDLWSDWQLMLYSAYLEPEYGEFAGAIHNIVEKPTIKRKTGETDEEFAARRAEAKAPNRCRQAIAETDAEWAARLADHYLNPAKFHREVVYFTAADLARAREELWQVAQDVHLAHAENRWYRSPNMCRQYGSVCEYLPLCRSDDNPIIKETQFHHHPAHSEVIAATQESP